MNQSNFRHLSQPFLLGEVRLKNRIVKSPAVTNYAADDGYVTEGHKDFYEVLAKGGVGLMIVEATCVDYPLANSRNLNLGAHEDRFVPGLSELVHILHENGCPAFLQLHHAGPMHPRARYGLQPVASSNLTALDSPEPYADAARALTVTEIKDIEGKFARAALRAKTAGFDGIELQFAHNYLINSFISRAWNKRTDLYGAQTLENRIRFAIGIIREVKKLAGANFPVGVRINGNEWGMKNCLTSEESKEIALLLEREGIAYIHVSGYGYREFGRAIFPEQILYPEPSSAAKPFASIVKKEGLFLSAARAIKKAVRIPVIVAGGLTPELGERILQRGQGDLISFTRCLQADPELPNKIFFGRGDEVVPCVSCYTCVNLAAMAKPVRCRVNPAMGKEKEYAIAPAVRKKRVLVVGGGPAGLEVARVAAMRGHDVHLIDKQRKLGGLLPLAALINGTEIEPLPALIRYFEKQLQKWGVKVTLNSNVDAAVVEKAKPEVVVLAVGATPVGTKVPGFENRNVTDSLKMRQRVQSFLAYFSPETIRRLSKFYLPIGRRVVVMGGLIHGCEIADFLVRCGRDVTITEESNQVGAGIIELHKNQLIEWLKRKGVKILAEVKCDEITDSGLVVSKGGKKEEIKADTIFVALPPMPNTELAKSLQGKVAEIYEIGDGREPKLIIDAIEDGRRIGCTL